MRGVQGWKDRGCSGWCRGLRASLWTLWGGRGAGLSGCGDGCCWVAHWNPQVGDGALGTYRGLEGIGQAHCRYSEVWNVLEMRLGWV